MLIRRTVIARAAFTILATLAATGCTPFTIEAEADRDAAKGIPVYEVEAYLFVTTAVKKVGDEDVLFYSGELKQVRTPKVLYRIKPSASLNGTLTVKWDAQGNVSEINGASDAKVPEMIGAIAGLIPTLTGAKANLTDKPSAATPRPLQVFRLNSENAWVPVNLPGLQID
jgi:hypothetical protein